MAAMPGTSASCRVVQNANYSNNNDPDHPVAVVKGPLAFKGLGLVNKPSGREGGLLDTKFQKAYLSCRSISTGLVPPDLNVIVKGNKVIQIHKDVFIAMSNVFEDLLDKMGTINGCGKPSVELVDIEADVFKIIKCFCYNMSIPQFHILHVDKKLKLLETSIQFNIDLLIPYVIKAITETMLPVDFCKILKVARSLEIADLETHVLELIWSNGDHVLNQDDFSKLGFYDAERILCSDSLMCSTEITVYNAALRWATEQATPSKKVKKALQYNFGKIMTCIRFANMTGAEFSHVVQNAPSEFMSTADIIQLYIHITVKPDKIHPLPSKFVCTSRCLPTQSGPAPSLSAQTNLDSIIMPPPMRPKNTDSKKRSSVVKSSVVSFSIPPTPTSIKNEVLTYDSDDDTEDDLFYSFNAINVNNKCFDSFEEVVRKYYGKEDKDSLGAFRFEKVSCENIYRILVVKNCKEVSIDLNYNYISAETRVQERSKLFLEFVRMFDPLRYMVFYTKRNQQISLKQLMASGLEKLLLRFNGVTFLESLSNNSELVLNYMRDSRKILRLDKLKLTKLAMSNCEFSTKIIKEKGQLKSLVLYRVWGEYSVEEIIKDFPKLEILVCWKNLPQEWGGIYPNFSKSICLNTSNLGFSRNTLSKLVLFEAELRFPTRSTFNFLNLSELLVENCYYAFTGQRGKISETFPSVFPNLQKLVIIEPQDDSPRKSLNQFSFGNSSLLNSVVSRIEPMEWIRVIGMKWGFGYNVDDSDTVYAKFLSKSKFKSRKISNYFLQKKDGIWDGKDLGDDDEAQITDLVNGNFTQRDQIEYVWYELSNFYASLQTFEDYFLQGNGNKNEVDTFPKPVLWC